MVESLLYVLSCYSSDRFPASYFSDGTKGLHHSSVTLTGDNAVLLGMAVRKGFGPTPNHRLVEVTGVFLGGKTCCAFDCNT
jgi:hypothetical protein